MSQVPGHLQFPVSDSPDEDDVVPANAERTIVGGLFSKHAKRIRRFLSYRLRNDADAQDAAQDVFLRLWRHERQGTLREEATSYMFSATHSVAVDVERRRSLVGKELDAEADPDAVLKDHPTQDDVAHWRGAMAVFVESLKTLPDKPREALVLYHFRNLGFDEVAAHMGVSRRTVERYLTQALIHCRKDLERFL